MGQNELLHSSLHWWVAWGAKKHFLSMIWSLLSEITEYLMVYLEPGELMIPYRYRQLKKATLEQEKCARASICILSVPHSEFFSLLRQQNDRLESWFCSKFQHMGYKQRWCNWCSRGRQKMININVKKSTCDIWSKERISWVSNCVNTCMPICFSLSSNPIFRSFVIRVSVFNVSDY